VIAVGWGLYALLGAIEGGAGPLVSFPTLLERAPDDVLHRGLWLLGDTTEAQFYASAPAGIGLLAGALLAYRLDRARSRWRGFPISYGTGLWPWVLAASGLGLLVSVAVYGGMLDSGEPVPTFVPFVSIPAGVLLVYGPGWRTVATGGVLGGLIGFPIAYAVTAALLEPLALPSVIGSVTGMWLGGILVFELCHRALPWMRRPARAEEAADERPRSAAIDRPGWLARRTLADFSEPQFFGNELASAGLIAGVTLSWVVDSGEAAYGSGLLPDILVSQIMASSIGIALFHGRWRALGWYPTFVPVVSVAPAVVLTYGGGVDAILGGALLGAAIGPPIGQFLIARSPAHWHVYVGATASMALSTAIVVGALSVLPGFDR
jgi:hypothetical protein